LELKKKRLGDKKLELPLIKMDPRIRALGEGRLRLQNVIWGAV
jgi:hypothetical protein